MKILDSKLNGALVLKTDLFFDKRGFLQESYSKKRWEEIGININFVQDNHSFSLSRGTLRGLHFQTKEKAQTKLVRCIKGTILDVIVDLRQNSSTFKQTFSIELSEENNLQLLIPKGFAHGFLCLTDNCHVFYKMDEFYSPSHQSGILWSDPNLNIHWPIPKNEIILSDQDSHLDPFSSNRDYF